MDRVEIVRKKVTKYLAIGLILQFIGYTVMGLFFMDTVIQMAGDFHYFQLLIFVSMWFTFILAYFLIPNIIKIIKYGERKRKKKSRVKTYS